MTILYWKCVKCGAEFGAQIRSCPMKTDWNSEGFYDACDGRIEEVTGEDLAEAEAESKTDLLREEI